MSDQHYYIIHSDEVIPPDKKNLEVSFSDSYLKTPHNSLYKWSCGVRLNAVIFDVGCDIMFDDLRYCYSRLFSKEGTFIPTDTGNKVCLLVETKRTGIFYYNNKKYQIDFISSEQNWDHILFLEDIFDIINSVSEPINDDLNYIYQEVLF